MGQRPGNPGSSVETDDGVGPPTWEDDAWYTHAVVSRGYPRVKRDPKPAEGQMLLINPSFDDAMERYPRRTRIGEQRVLLGRGIWLLGGSEVASQEVHVEEPGWYRLEGTDWVRDEIQDDA